jgi:hypothetical protein
MKITICGSMMFSEEMIEAKKQLELLGHKVVIPALAESFVGKTDQEKIDLAKLQKIQTDAIREHYNEIKNSDAILVLNYDKKGIPNYIGGNSLLEIGFAHVLNKRIYLFNSIPEIEFYKSEIEAVKPVIINKDFSLLK